MLWRIEEAETGDGCSWDVLCASSELILEVRPLNTSQPVSFRGHWGVRPCVQMLPLHLFLVKNQAVLAQGHVG